MGKEGDVCIKIKQTSLLEKSLLKKNVYLYKLDKKKLKIMQIFSHLKNQLRHI